MLQDVSELIGGSSVSGEARNFPSSEPHISTPSEHPCDSTSAALCGMHGSNHPSEDDKLRYFEDSRLLPDPKTYVCYTVGHQLMA